eukprot:m.206329 g.206329  ORF g.206329 m.206329 type:complete len:55 (-) comp15020_c1_seq5:657-821(-)
MVDFYTYEFKNKRVASLTFSRAGPRLLLDGVVVQLRNSSKQRSHKLLWQVNVQG